MRHRHFWSLVAFCFAVSLARPGQAVLAGDLLITDGENDILTRARPSSGSLLTIGPRQSPLAVGMAIDPPRNVYLASEDNAVLRVSPSTGVQTGVSAGGGFSQPSGVAVGADGSLFVADTSAGAIFGVDPASGVQTSIAAEGSLPGAYDIAVGPEGALFVSAFERDIYQVDPPTGALQPVTTSGAFRGIGVGPNGELYAATGGSIVRVDPVTGSLTTVAQPGGVVRDVAVDENGVVFATARIPFLDLFVGAVFRVDPMTGHTQGVFLGERLYYPTGIAVVPSDFVPERATALLLGAGLAALATRRRARRPLATRGARHVPRAVGAATLRQVGATDDRPNTGNAGSETQSCFLVAPLRFCVLIAAFLAGPAHAGPIIAGDLVLVEQQVFNPETDVYESVVTRVRPSTGSRLVLAAGLGFGLDIGIDVDPSGNVFVASPDGPVIRISTTTGERTQVTDFFPFGQPSGLAVAADGTAFVTDIGGAIYRVDPTTGGQTPVVPLGTFVAPRDVVIGPGGDLLVSESGGDLFEIDPDTGATRQVTTSGAFLGLGIGPNGDVYATTSSSVVRVDLVTGSSTTIALHSGRDVAVGDDGDLFVTDWAFLEAYGAIYRIDPATGHLNDVYQLGLGSHPTGIAVVPSTFIPEPATALLLGAGLAALAARRRARSA